MCGINDLTILKLQTSMVSLKKILVDLYRYYYIMCVFECIIFVHDMIIWPMTKYGNQKSPLPTWTYFNLSMDK